MPTEEYICKKGDSFTKISLCKLGCLNRANEIADINHMSVQALLDEGQVILVPTNK